MTDFASDAPPLPFDRGSSPLDPPPQFAQWREDGPIRRVSLVDGRSHWLVTRYDDIRAVLAETRVSADRTRPGFPGIRPDEPAPPPGTFIATDPPLHSLLRRMLTRTFMVKSIERLRPAIQRITDDLLDCMARLPQPVDLIEHFALPLPSLVICELFGVPYADRDVFQRHSRTIVNMNATNEDVAAARQALGDYLIGLLDEKDRDPGDDLFSELAVKRVRTGEVSREEAAGMGTLLLVGGHETTANMIGLSTLALLREPAQSRRLLTEPESVPGAVEELLRYLTVAHFGLRRVATADFDIGGVTVRAGEGLIMPLQSANRDPDVFDLPDRLDLGRDARRHIAFGYGVHQCLGQPLARVELQIALPALLARFPGLRVTVPYERIAYRQGTTVHGVRELPVSW
ncbi:cytochrome P450 [Streptomyces sp. NPDC005648]|uniref:cytochrome P450 n=1 Tax=Streptomyces sp. NPDC005648 TaxID=3157044 RepID=UPI0033B26894